MAAILYFLRIFADGVEKHKFASISLTMRDGAISSKTFTPQGIGEMYSWQFS